MVFLNYPFFWINASTLACLTFVTVVGPFWILGFYLKNFDKWENEDWQEKWGAPLEGLRKNTKWSVFYPIWFLIRRIMFIYTAIYH